MTGIDHSNASIELREKFSFTKLHAAELMKKIARSEYINGCAMILTCNRTELWVSFSGEAGDFALAEMFREAAGFDSSYDVLFTQRESAEAVQHLFELACGMRSMLFGEVQIITQVKDAIVHSRENGLADPVLESLFGRAVACAKKVISTVRLTQNRTSAADSCMEIISRRFGDLSSLRCLVIGNGEMGRHAAAVMAEAGCTVEMTLRQYKKGQAVIPFGCSAVSYDDRYSRAETADIIISATLSPHYTLTGENFVRSGGAAEALIFDLAVPRDIDPEIRSRPDVMLYDIDDLGGSSPDEADDANIKEAEEMIKKDTDEFVTWYSFRDYIPMIDEICSAAAYDIKMRTAGRLKNELSAEQQDKVISGVYDAAYKAVGKLMYGFKNNLSKELWQNCFESIKKSAEK